MARGSVRRALLAAAVVTTGAVGTAQPAAAGDRVLDRNGVVYRHASDGRLRFHPLLSFQQLNGYMDAGRRRAAGRLARALIARGRRSRSALVWDYRFRYAGSPQPWQSGMAQAVAAEALARAGYRKAARRAFLAVPPLLARTSGQPWIRLYSFDALPVLNAQLQSALSLRRYGRIARDRRAIRLSIRLVAAADMLFPRFETACWSRYSIDGAEADPLYHRYVGELVMRVAAVTRTASWRTRAARFFASHRRPVLLRGRGLPTLFPVPAEGFRDTARVSFWLSKCAWVTLRVGRRETREWFPRGWQEIVWRPRAIPGNYPASLSAQDNLGRRTTIRLRPFVIRRDGRAPVVRVAAGRQELRWLARDGATPWLQLALELDSAGGRLVLPLGRMPKRGSTLLPPVPWRGAAELLVSDSSGNTTRVRLGEVGPLGRLGGPGLFAAATS
jgi:D-glucuronyl C5-epimerase C-terminus